MLSIAISEHRPAKRHGLQHTSLIYAQSTPPFLEYQCADIVLVVQHFHRLVGHNTYRHIGQCDVRPNVHQKCRLKPHRLDHMFAQAPVATSLNRVRAPAWVAYFGHALVVAPDNLELAGYASLQRAYSAPLVGQH